MSHFWRELFKAKGTSLHRSSAYHPQSDGQTEVVNKCLGTYLRCFIQGHPRNWAIWLPWAEYWYNTSVHTSTKCTPFKALYGRDPPQLLRYDSGSSAVGLLEESLMERDAILDDLRGHLLKAQQRMKQQEDAHRRDVEFKVGEQVYLKLQPYRQSSVARRMNEKLSPRFFGPFEIIQKVGKVAYKLQLPPTAKIHNVFHVSQLKAAIGTSLPPSTIPPQLTSDMVLETEPEAVLGVRNVAHGSQILVEVLIQWKGLPEFDATWDDYNSILTLFPSFHLEDKVTVGEGGNAIPVTNTRPPIRFTYARRKRRN